MKLPDSYYDRSTPEGKAFAKGFYLAQEKFLTLASSLVYSEEDRRTLEALWLIDAPSQLSEQEFEYAQGLLESSVLER